MSFIGEGEKEKEGDWGVAGGTRPWRRKRDVREMLQKGFVRGQIEAG